MARKPLQHIMNGSSRKKTLAKRRAAMYKQAQDLSSLCAVDVGILTYSHDEGHFSAWPDHSAMKNMLERFSRVPVVTRTHKMVSHESYLTNMIAKEEKKIEKARKENDKAEAKEIMKQALEGKSIDEFNTFQISNLYFLAAEQIKAIEKRDQCGKSNVSSTSHDMTFGNERMETRGGGQEMRSSSPKPMELFIKDQSSIDLMEFGLETGGLSKRNEEVFPKEFVASTSGNKNDEEPPEDLDSFFPDIYFP